jgi:hypothetical protein
MPKIAGGGRPLSRRNGTQSPLYAQIAHALGASASGVSRMIAKMSKSTQSTMSLKATFGQQAVKG